MCCPVPARGGTEIICTFNEECVESDMCGTNGFILTDPDKIEARDQARKGQLGPYRTVSWVYVLLTDVHKCYIKLDRYAAC